MADWLRAYTAGAALAGGQEGERGALQAGLRADPAVLAPTTTGPSSFRVDATWIGGREVFGRTSGTD